MEVAVLSRSFLSAVNIFPCSFVYRWLRCEVTIDTKDSKFYPTREICQQRWTSTHVRTKTIAIITVWVQRSWLTKRLFLASWRDRTQRNFSYKQFPWNEALEIDCFISIQVECAEFVVLFFFFSASVPLARIFRKRNESRDDWNKHRLNFVFCFGRCCNRVNWLLLETKPVCKAGEANWKL